ncbi:MAG: hypothetical protein BAJALOKI3v1_50105 [Promethearchaeota archaeon]|nr:MAG: hypothetical protein BAJALOKI3v1_50105 [Candidatus Lokiarchaeota archaeon]
MKIAYIAPYRDGTGYSQAAIANILAMDEVGIEVVPRHVKMTNSVGNVPNRVTDLEENDLNNVDAVIQHNLPSEFCRNGDIPHIGIFAYETDKVASNNWKYHLDLMDLIVTLNTFQKEAIEQVLPDKTVKVITTPIIEDQKRVGLSFDLPIKGKTVFYTISELTERKGIHQLLAAYYNTFSCYDNVILLIKGHKAGLSPQDSLNYINDLSNNIKNRLNKYSDNYMYPQILVMPEYLSDEQINYLHRIGDVFVSASKGEAYCIPFVDAMHFGNPTIVPYHTAFREFAYDRNLLVNSISTPCFGYDGGISRIYTSRETWHNIEQIDLQCAFRVCHNKLDSFTNQKIVNNRKNHCNKLFNSENIGNMFKETIENAIKA